MVDPQDETTQIARINYILEMLRRERAELQRLTEEAVDTMPRFGTILDRRGTPRRSK
jgi:hypothetical protein